MMQALLVNGRAMVERVKPFQGIKATTTTHTPTRTQVTVSVGFAPFWLYEFLIFLSARLLLLLSYTVSPENHLVARKANI